MTILIQNPSEKVIYGSISVSRCSLIHLIANIHIFQSKTIDNLLKQIWGNINDHMYIHNHQFGSCFLSTILFIPQKVGYYIHDRRLINVLLDNIIINPGQYNFHIKH